MTDIHELFRDIGFSVNEAKVYTALVTKSPLNGYETAKRANVTRTMVYDILSRMVNKGVIEVIVQNGTNLYSPVPYKELFRNLKEVYNERLQLMEETLDSLESDRQNDNYINNITDYENMIAQIRALIRGAQREIYLSLWYEEARLFMEDLKAANEKGVSIITFSFCAIPYDFGVNYYYGIPSKQLGRIWSRRRITVVADRERVIIGEGNEAIEEISVITNNTMLTEMAIDQITLDIIHLHEMKSRNLLPDSITDIGQYTGAADRFHALIGIDPERLPKRADQD